MKSLPNRSNWFREKEAEWSALEREYYEQFPAHEHAGIYLAAYPVRGVIAQHIPGIGNVLVGWPDAMPHPDIEAWVTEQEAARAAAEAEAQRQAEEAARAEAARLEEETAARAVEEAALAEKRAALEADQQLVEAALEKGAEMTPEVAGAVLRIAAAGAQRLRG